MKIYQIHKWGGQWEDSYDYIVGSYLHKEKAEMQKLRLEAEEQGLRNQSKKCNECPYLYDYFVGNEKLLEYCPRPDLEEYADGIDCANYYQLWDESDFKIKEIEVEE